MIVRAGQIVLVTTEATQFRAVVKRPFIWCDGCDSQTYICEHAGHEISVCSSAMSIADAGGTVH